MAHSNSPASTKLNQLLDQTLSRLQKMRESRSEPIAIVGMACRFAQASSPDAFWDVLHHGRCVISDTPSERWENTPRTEQQIAANRGSYLAGVDQFDASFFNLARREANLLDPQQRLMLEVAWEAIENAGVNPQSLRGSQVGVYWGLCTNDYLQLFLQQKAKKIDPWLSTGNAHGSAVGRLSYFFDWSGPSLAIDTACSSSLVAIHLAVQALRNNECTSAMVGGVNLMLTPELSLSLSEAGMLSPDGLCQTFSDTANGFVRGEGCGALYLKRLSAAQADGNPIVCVIRGSASNQDGRSIGLTAPRGPAQQAVIQQALSNAQTKPEEVSYIEAHGTGTALGDPIELSALQAVFGKTRCDDDPLTVGSVKTNLGHLEGAAGVAGTIKTALALSRSEIPPHLHFRQPSSKIDWTWPVQVAADVSEWKRQPQRSRVAGVSSFGFGGTNAHVVLAEAPVEENAPIIHGPLTAKLLKLSAKSLPALKELVERYIECLNDVELSSACHTSCVGRADFEYRLILRANAVRSTQQMLRTWLDRNCPTEHIEGIYCGHASGESLVDWVFPDLADFTPIDVEELLQLHPLLPGLWDEVSCAVQSVGLKSLTDLIETADQRSLQERRIIQLALQVIFGRLWLKWGLVPNQVIGIGSGELAAACIAGIVSLQDAIRLASGQTSNDQVAISAPLYTYCRVEVRESRSEGNWIEDWWEKYVRSSAHSLAEIVEDGTTVLCLGDPASLGLIDSLPSNDDDVCVAALPRGPSPAEQVLKAWTQLYAAGMTWDWTKLCPEKLQRTRLPNYPFQRKRYWLPTETRTDSESTQVHPYLRTRVENFDDRREIQLDLSSLSGLGNHRLREACLCPLTFYLEFAVASLLGADHSKWSSVRVSDLSVRQPLLWSEDTACQVRLILSKDVEKADCQIQSFQDQHWVTHATCSVETITTTENGFQFSAVKGGTVVSQDDHYRECESAGILYAGDFRCLESIEVSSDRKTVPIASGRVRLPNNNDAAYYFHPAALDGCLQLTMASLAADERERWLPSGIQSYELLASPSSSSVLVYMTRLDRSSDRQRLVDLAIFDEKENPVAYVKGLTLQASTREAVDVLPGPTTSEARLAVQLREMSPQEFSESVQDYVVSRLATALDLTASELSMSQSLIDLGMDSMMALELRNDFQSDLGIDFSMEELLDVLTPADLVSRLELHLQDGGGQRSDESSIDWIEGAI